MKKLLTERTEQYSSAFYSGHADRSRSSAIAVLRILYEHYRPQRVVDVGCGTGAWLAAAEELGTPELLGYDGTWVNSKELLSKNIQFTAVDFESCDLIPVNADLCICAEVAEHLPEKRSDSLIGIVTNIADIICFSAAVPGQGGTRHVNEQRQSYWIAKFADHGFEMFDLFRPQIWNDSSVESWYRQNMFLFVRRESLRIDRNALQLHHGNLEDCIHPDLFEIRLREFGEIVKHKNYLIQQPSGRFVCGVIFRFLKRILTFPIKANES